MLLIMQKEQRLEPTKAEYSKYLHYAFQTSYNLLFVRSAECKNSFISIVEWIEPNNEVRTFIYLAHNSHMMQDNNISVWEIQVTVV